MKHALILTSADGSETLTLLVPTTWDDVSLQQYIDWQCSDAPAVVMLSGITQLQLDRLAWQDAEYLSNLLAFAASLPDPPLSADLKDPGSATYGQMVLATQYFDENPAKPAIWYAPYLYALYRCREVWGRNDQGKEQAMMEAVLQEPVGQCLNNVLFFTAAWWISSNATPAMPKTASTLKTKNWKQESRNWVSALASPCSSTASPAAGA